MELEAPKVFWCLSQCVSCGSGWVHAKKSSGVRGLVTPLTFFSTWGFLVGAGQAAPAPSPPTVSFYPQRPRCSLSIMKSSGINFELNFNKSFIHMNIWWIYLSPNISAMKVFSFVVFNMFIVNSNSWYGDSYIYFRWFLKREQFFVNF